MNENLKYDHIISLGYYCSVASDLERMGLRDASYPFDWLISSFEGVICLIENEFKDFLRYEILSQDSLHRQHYRNDKYNLVFYHDFNKFSPLNEQIEDVQEKYRRRIDRFYKNISEPTLFIRYISDENKDRIGNSAELLWIENNIERINHLIKRYNINNEIIFIGNTGLSSDVIDIYCVDKDKNDTVARKPVDKNADLALFLNQIDFPNKQNNLLRYRKKTRFSLLKKIRRKVISVIRKILGKVLFLYKPKILSEYVHNKTYDE